MAAYEAVIGLESHVQVRTASKMFCSCPNKYGAEPNTMVCPVCMGYPGSLPTPNREAIRKTVMAGLMCSCSISKYSKFDRKNYFYPDMPKDYQLTQYDLPFCGRGEVHICGKGFSGAELPDKAAYVAEMARASRRWVLLVACNNLQAGYPLHRAIHRAWGFPWTHGDTHYNYFWNVKSLMQEAGLRIREAGTIDSPPWPDPVGFRDVRLHRKGASGIPFGWEVPAMDHIAQGRFPAWMDALRAYDLRFRRGWIKLLFSHLFYVLGEKR